MFNRIQRILGQSSGITETEVNNEMVSASNGTTRISLGISSNNTDGYSIRTNPTDIYTQEEFNQARSGEIVNHDFIVRNGVVDKLAPITVIQGTLGLSDCRIETLSPLISVRDDIWCSFHNRKPILKTLGSLRKVGGNANFRFTPLEDMGNLEYVGGNLSLRDTNISSLGKVIHVGGNLSLPKRLKGQVDLSGVFIGGQVKYWNDAKNTDLSLLPDEFNSILQKSKVDIPYWPQTYIYPNHDIRQEPKEVQAFYLYFKDCFFKGILLDTEGYSNYCFLLVFDLQRQIRDPKDLAVKYDVLSKGYPKLKGYCDDILIDLYKENQMFDEAWNIVKTNPVLDIKTVYYYANYIGDHIFDGFVAQKICGTGCLTSFGKAHTDEIIPFFRPSLEAFEKEKHSRFYDLFYDKDKGYRSINGKYDSEYYRQFYQLDEGSFNLYDEIGRDPYHARNLDDILVVNHAVLEQLRVLFINAEDAYRESIGAPKIGEGWISETALFYRIKEHYKDHNVVQHGHPKWLGKQHLDIYFTNENIGVEYQGIQHYQPIEYFGGEKGFASSKERDERKKRLCNENGCTLIYVNEGYEFEDVVKEIDNAIQAH